MRLIAAAVVAVALAVGVALLAPRSSEAHDYSVGSLHIEHPHANPTPGGRLTTAAYLTIHNSSAQGDRLVSASSPLAQRVEIHRSSTDSQGVARMDAQPGGVAIPGQGQVVFERGGLHLMVINLSQPLAEGDELPLTLVFERAGSVAVTATVERPLQRQASPQHHH